MYKYKCNTCGDTIEVTKVTMKCIPDIGVVHDVLCSECNEYMQHTNPMKGAPKFWQKPT